MADFLASQVDTMHVQLDDGPQGMTTGYLTFIDIVSYQSKEKAEC